MPSLFQRSNNKPEYRVRLMNYFRQCLDAGTEPDFDTAMKESGYGKSTVSKQIELFRIYKPRNYTINDEGYWVTDYGIVLDGSRRHSRPESEF